MMKIILAVLIAIAATGSAIASPEVSRTSGVAPLVVHFWADPEPSDNVGAEPFHDYEYSWNFGDSTSGTWGLSGKSKNTDKGPVAAHVYETPGTYTAVLVVRNPNTGATTSTSSFEITVSNPDTVFADTKTTCISTTSDFTGCPSGAAQVTTSSLAGLSGYTDAGERVLLRRGDSWTVGSSITFPNNSGPVHIGAFGTCTSPDELGICSNAPQIATGTTFLNTSLKADWRLTDIKFQGTGDPYGGSQNPRNMLAYRLNVAGGGAIGLTHTRDSDAEWTDGASVISNRVVNATSMASYIGSERLVFMGNELYSTGTTASHIVRIWQSYKGVISHNRISGAGPSLHALKFHGPVEDDGTGSDNRIGTYAETLASGLRYPSYFNVVANNTFGGGASYTVAIAPQDTSRDERLQDVIFEKNKILMDYQAVSTGSVGLNLVARYVTIRNNVMDGTGAGSAFIGVLANNNGAATFDGGDLIGVRMYNNTFYSRSTHSSVALGARLYTSVNGAILRNNYLSFPNGTGTRAMYDLAGTGLIQSNNVYTNTAYLADPDSATPLSRNYALTASSTAAIDQGYTVPVRDDYLGAIRSGLTYDVGAYEYEAPQESTGGGKMSGGGAISSGGYMR